MKNNIFLGICILLASLILSVSIIYCVKQLTESTKYAADANRYYFTITNGREVTFDKMTGDYYYYSTEEFFKKNDVKHIK